VLNMNLSARCYDMSCVMPIYCVDTGVGYRNPAVASLVTGISVDDILACCNGDVQCAGGCRWRLEVRKTFKI